MFLFFVFYLILLWLEDILCVIFVVLNVLKLALAGDSVGWDIVLYTEKLAVSVSGEGTYLGCRFHAQLGHIIDVSFFLPFCLSLSKSKHNLGWGLNKKVWGLVLWPRICRSLHLLLRRMSILLLLNVLKMPVGQFGLLCSSLLYICWFSVSLCIFANGILKSPNIVSSVSLFLIYF